jgi:hypothetical protein
VAAEVEVNVCEHGDHPAPDGQIFCSKACKVCEATEHDATKTECAGICTAPKLTDLEAEVLGRVVRGEDPWLGKGGRVGSRRVSQTLGRLWRKGCYIGENDRRIVTDAGRAALEAHEARG